jgi:hypothetical protein
MQKKPTLKRFLDKHYVVNVLILSLFPLFYAWGINAKETERAEQIKKWTAQALKMFTITMIMKLRKIETLDKFVSDFILHSKTSVLFLSLCIDRKVFWIFGSLYYFHYLLCQLRAYEFETNVEHLNIASFERRVKIGATKGECAKKWIVMFYAPWHPPCNQFDATFAALSLEFENKAKDLMFAKFDLSRWPGASIDHGIDLTGNSKQLPTIIMFDNGGEVERMPRCSKKGEIETRVAFSAAEVIKRFGLKDLS